MTTLTRRQSLVLPAMALLLSEGFAQAAELNPAAVTFKLPDQIPWGALPRLPAIKAPC